VGLHSKAMVWSGLMAVWQQWSEERQRIGKNPEPSTRRWSGKGGGKKKKKKRKKRKEKSSDEKYLP
jgi:hypothetical protein